MPVTPSSITERLAAHGYRLERATEQHQVYEHHGDRVVVPGHSRELTPWAAHVIEWTLEPRLGPGWLSAPRPHGERDLARPPAPDRLHAVIRHEGGTWNAFVAEEPRILTFATTLEEVQQRTRDAVAVWFDAATSVDVVPVIQLDPATQASVEAARGPDASPEAADRARTALERAGLSEVDIRTLLPGSVAST